MKAVPIELKAANEYVAQNHRHHSPVYRDKFRVACTEHGRITLEVTRCCTDGTANACSFLYGRVARIAKEMGYERIITYILISESGASLKAAGWECEKEIAGGGSWDTPARRRHTTAPQCKKQRWMKNLCKEGDESRESELSMLLYWIRTGTACRIWHA